MHARFFITVMVGESAEMYTKVSLGLHLTLLAVTAYFVQVNLG